MQCTLLSIAMKSLAFGNKISFFGLKYLAFSAAKYHVFFLFFLFFVVFFFCFFLFVYFLCGKTTWFGWQNACFALQSLWLDWKVSSLNGRNSCFGPKSLFLLQNLFFWLQNGMLGSANLVIWFSCKPHANIMAYAGVTLNFDPLEN